MGHVATVGYDRFPRQGDKLHRAVFVCFDYDTSRQLRGTIVRDDVSDPFECIIALDDGRFVRAVECQYNVPR